MRLLTILFTLFSIQIGLAQLVSPLDVPTPSGEQEKPVIILGATIHTANGLVIPNGYIRFEEGIVKEVRPSLTKEVLPDNVHIIRAKGKHVYPGFIALNTTIGLQEVEAVRASNDEREVGGLNPHVRSIIAYNTESRITPTLRSNGVLLAQVMPKGGNMLSGTSSLVQLDAWNWEDAVLVEDDAMHLYWPTEFRATRWWDRDKSKAVQESENYMERMMELHTLFQDAKAYNSKKDEPNQRLEAVKQLLEGKSELFIHVSQAAEILSALDWVKEWKIKPVLVGAEEAILVTNEVKEHTKGIILTDIHRLPSASHADINEFYSLPAKVAEQGIPFSIAVNGYWQVRNLPFHLGTAIAYGLDAELALQSVTAMPAKFSGLNNGGKLVVGNQANLFISEGDVFDMRTSKIQYAWIEGRQITLDNHQKALYRKYGKKLGIDTKE